MDVFTKNACSHSIELFKCHLTLMCAATQALHIKWLQLSTI